MFVSVSDVVAVIVYLEWEDEETIRIISARNTTTVETDLSRLRPLQIECLDTGDARLPLFNYLLHRYHYLGHQRCVGENLKVMVSDRAGQLLACMLFGSAAWKAKSRDAFIGWDRATLVSLTSIAFVRVADTMAFVAQTLFQPLI